jgi:hypothetical protein
MKVGSSYIHSLLLVVMICASFIHPTHAFTLVPDFIRCFFDSLLRFGSTSSASSCKRSNSLFGSILHAAHCPTIKNETIFCTAEYKPISCGNDYECKYTNPCQAVRAGFNDLEMNCTLTRRLRDTKNLV